MCRQNEKVKHSSKIFFQCFSPKKRHFSTQHLLFTVFPLLFLHLEGKTNSRNFSFSVNFSFFDQGKLFLGGETPAVYAVDRKCLFFCKQKNVAMPSRGLKLNCFFQATLSFWKRSCCHQEFRGKSKIFFNFLCDF